MIPAARPRALVIVLAAVMLFATMAGLSPAQSQPSDVAPTLRLARGEDGKVTLAFTTVAGAKEYAVRVVADAGKSEIIPHVEVTNYTVHGLANGRQYRIAVCAVFDGRQCPWSNELSATPVDQPAWDTLREAFASNNPTRNSNPFTMVQGKETEAELRAIIRAAYDAGFEGVTLHPYGYEDYLAPGQWDRWKIIFDQARRLGLAVWQQDDRNYPSGFAMGKVVAAHPEFGRTRLVEAAQHDLTGPQKAFSLDVQSLLQGRDFLVAVSAYPASGEPLDLTDRVVKGKLAWDVPAGRWRLFVVKAVWLGPMGVADSNVPMPFIDLMNPKATDAYIQTIYQAEFDHFGSEFGRTFKGFFSDEAPVDFTLFTPDFLERFEKSKGYSLRKWLPSVTRDLSARDKQIRFDYRDFIREQTTVVFFGRSRQWCRDHGIQLIGHVIEDHQQDMRRLEMLDFPGCDNVFGQWYDPDPDVYWRIPRMVSSVAHYGGSRNDIALIEHFAATGWRTGLSEMKRMMDWSTVMGINQVVPCGLSTQSPPVWEVCPDFWLHGKNPQFPYFHEYQVAANRMTMMMRGGRHVAPAIVLDTTESQWIKDGTDLGTQHGARDDLWKTCAAMSQAHVDFDLIPYSVFCDEHRTTFDKGTIRIGKEDYRAVVLPGVEFVPGMVVERLWDFRRSGGIVVAVGRTPARLCDGEEGPKVEAAIARVWTSGDTGLGKAAVATFDNLQKTLISLDVPDVRMTPSPKQVLYCHRRLHDKNLYFFANTGAEPVSTEVELRGAHGAAMSWDPLTGAILWAGKQKDGDRGLRLRLGLGEYASEFVVTESEPIALPSFVADLELEVTTLPLKLTWQVGKGVDENHRIFTADAKLPTDWQANQPAWLSLQGASQIISVKINDKPAGHQFCPPYSFDVSRELHAGSNRLEVERIGRIVLPNSCVPTYGVNDAAATTPCTRAVLETLPLKVKEAEADEKGNR
jgi:alpha-L-rhamnosidase